MQNIASSGTQRIERQVPTKAVVGRSPVRDIRVIRNLFVSTELLKQRMTSYTYLRRRPLDRHFEPHTSEGGIEFRKRDLEATTKRMNPKSSLAYLNF